MQVCMRWKSTRGSGTPIRTNCAPHGHGVALAVLLTQQKEHHALAAQLSVNPTQGGKLCRAISCCEALRKGWPDSFGMSGCSEENDAVLLAS
jgi:hypothetical protein